MRNILLLLLSLLAGYANAASTNITVGWPLDTDTTGTISAPQTNAIETQNEAVAGCFYLPIADTITAVGFLNHTATNGASIADNSYTVSIQALDASGVPTNTPLGGGSPASATFPQSGAAGGVALGSVTNHVVTLSNSISLSGGTPYCVVVQHTGATDVTNFITARVGYSSSGTQAFLPFTATADNTGAWAKSANIPLGFTLVSATRVYGYPFQNTSSQTISGTTEAGFMFNVPDFGTSSTVKICAVDLLQGGALSAGVNFTVSLYSDPTGTPVLVQQGVYDSDHIYASGAGSRSYLVTFPSPVAIPSNASYVVGVAVAGAGSWGLSEYIVPSTDVQGVPFGGLLHADRTLTDYPPSGNDTNAFTLNTVRVGIASINICDITPGSGSKSMGGVY